MSSLGICQGVSVCTPTWIAKAAYVTIFFGIPLFFFLFFYISWCLWISRKRQWVNECQAELRKHFPRYEQSKTLSPAGSPVHDVHESIEDVAVQNNTLNKESNDLPFDNPVTPPPRELDGQRRSATLQNLYPTPPPSSPPQTCIKEPSPTLISPIRRSSNQVSLRGVYRGIISTIFPREAPKPINHNYIRPYSCGRIHSSPEDHVLLCTPDEDLRERLEDEREARWELVRERKRARSTSRARSLSRRREDSA
jgi:hypothetical protein